MIRTSNYRGLHTEKSSDVIQYLHLFCVETVFCWCMMYKRVLCFLSIPNHGVAVNLIVIQVYHKIKGSYIPQLLKNKLKEVQPGFNCPEWVPWPCYYVYVKIKCPNLLLWWYEGPTLICATRLSLLSSLPSSVVSLTWPTNDTRLTQHMHSYTSTMMTDLAVLPLFQNLDLPL